MAVTRFACGIAVLSGLTLACSAAGAEAKTHRFAPSQDVTVSFELRNRRVTGSLVRFARNGVALRRNRSGQLVLKTNGSRTRRVPASRRPPRVSVALSARDGRAQLVVGGRQATVRGRFVAEDAVVVVRAARTIRALKILTGDATPVGHEAAPAPSSPQSEDAPPTSAPASEATTSPSTSPVLTPGPTPAPQATAVPTPDPTPAPVPSPSPARLFSADSVWNAPLADDAALDPASGALVKTLRETVAQNVAARSGPWIAQAQTTPLYVVPAGQATVRVQLDPGSWKLGLQQTFEAVPVPPDAVQAPGPDGHMTVWQPSTDRLWEFFRARKLEDGWHANFGGAMSNVSSSPGYFNKESWPGLSQTWWGATATSLPVIAGTMMIDELRAGVIPHALALNIPFALPKVYSWPAQRTDGGSTDPNAIPEGARFRLDPRLDIDSLNLPPMTRMMAKAVQRYGMIVRDQTGHAIAFFAENPAQLGTNPYTGTDGLFGGLTPNQLTAAFPWQHLQLLRMELHD